MILVDTSVWVDHLRSADHALSGLLTRGQVLGHAAVVGEVGLGSLSNRVEVIGLLGNLPQAVPATHLEVMRFIEDHHLHGIGIGYVDAHLLASTALTSGAALWTRDNRLRVASDRKSVV